MKTVNLTALVEKYLHILGAEDVARPIIEFVAPNLRRTWYGQCVWRPASPRTSIILLDRRLVAHPASLERILAHEMVHHVNNMQEFGPHFDALERGERAVYKVAKLKDGHGADFRRGAALVNAVMGADYVTKLSDSIELEANRKPFFVLVVSMEAIMLGTSSVGKFGWAWAIRPSQDGLRYAQRYIERGARVVRTTDDRWTEGAPLKWLGGFATPYREDIQSELRKLLEEGEPYELHESRVGVLPGKRPHLELVPAARGFVRGRTKRC